MKIREVDRAIFDAECGRATHTQYTTPAAHKGLSKETKEALGDPAFHRRLVAVYDRRLRVLRAYRLVLVTEAAQYADAETRW